MDNLKTKLVGLIDSIITNFIVSISATAFINIIPISKKFISKFFNNNAIIASIFILIMSFLLFDFCKRNIFYYTVYLIKNEIKRVYDYYSYTMAFINQETIQCNIKYKYRNTRSSMDSDSFAFKWQGDNYSIKSITNGYTLEKIKNRNGFEEYLIKFPRIIKRNESIEVELAINLFDANHTSIPEMQYNINNPTKNLKMELNMPMNIKLDYVTKECLIGNSDYAIFSESCDIQKRQFVIQKKKPLFLHKYKFTWQFSK
ncbi:MAG: hypothetical protein LKK00_01065 [Intestinimonas sp.]|jgi:hypothetical protein|nr:hypothetical protein [Intestinimonas sp.]